MYTRHRLQTMLFHRPSQTQKFMKISFIRSRVNKVAIRVAVGVVAGGVEFAGFVGHGLVQFAVLF
jgi:hypothetical protein